ncbi:MAG: glucose/sorbosone dehydrogenase-like protein [Bacteroidetes bacterium]|nr:glucose/sorbosone dehydrogenase-like protein [Bacteroidota bacterium]
MKRIFLLCSLLFIVIMAFCQKPQLALVQIAAGLDSPIDIRNCGDARIFIVEQHGRIKIMDKHGNINPTPFLDISSRVLAGGNEQGLLSLAFSPHYKQDSFFYVNYITGSGTGSTVISRFKVSATDSDQADASSERVLLTFPQPFTNHNGATLMFGRDGYLYDTQGDGGNAGDPFGNGQNKNVFLAKMLRFDVSDPDTTYTIPPSNPFVSQPNTKPEIWAYGLRNPWRCALDRLTADIWIADVGQDSMEEVNFQPALSTGGENYGWRCYEGTHLYDTTGCAGAGFTWPVYEYKHNAANGCSVTGGYVYRGTKFSRMFGRYFFTDFCSGRFWSARQTGPGSFSIDTFPSHLQYQYSTFGEDDDYELYIAGRGNGNIYHITDTSSCAPVAHILSVDSSHCDYAELTALAGDSLTYQWYYAFGGAITGANSATYRAGGSAWYQIKVSRPQGGCQSFSDSIYVHVQPCPGIHETDQDVIFTISPNPNHGLFTLNVQSNLVTTSTVSVVDQVGRVCVQQVLPLSQDRSHIPLDLSFLSKGVYSIILKNGGSMAQKRMILD